MLVVFATAAYNFPKPAPAYERVPAEGVSTAQKGLGLAAPQLARVGVHAVAVRIHPRIQARVRRVRALTLGCAADTTRRMRNRSYAFYDNSALLDSIRRDAIGEAPAEFGGFDDDDGGGGAAGEEEVN